MRALVTADLHYQLRQFDWLQEVAGDYDAVVLAGDFLDVAAPVPPTAQLVPVLRHLERLSRRTKLLVCSGNHDLTGRNSAGEKSAVWMDAVRGLGIPCDGDQVLADGVLVSICPWWDGPSSRAEVAAQLSRDAGSAPSAWIWMYHAPPPDSPTSWVGARHRGDEALAAWVQQYRPTAVLCGHIHQAPFLPQGSWIDRIGSTWVLNAGNQIGPVPTSIVVDTDARTASWRSLAGEHTIAFDDQHTMPPHLQST